MKSKQYRIEVKIRAVELLIESQKDYPSLWAAIQAIAPKFGCTPPSIWIMAVCQLIIIVQKIRCVLGRKNWLFAGSLRSGQRVAVIMSLVQSARLNGIDPYAYLADVLRRLPTYPNRQLDELLPHVWKMGQ